ncbi:hypothetical protein EDC01DRAFT_523300 [Geopyxis carbonaria]|nr:hypothetical protein EDC01DRAFT_523300 [Geopyxis carbonaria]
MQFTTILLAVVATLVSAQADNPTPNGECGGTAGFTCTTPGFGSCCSSSGYCGDTVPYCGQGCQSGFSLNSTSCLTGPGVPSVTGTCGTQNANVTCAGGAFDGSCCSKYGFCGTGVVYCSIVGGCQLGFGANCTSP